MSEGSRPGWLQSTEDQDSAHKTRRSYSRGDHIAERYLVKRLIGKGGMGMVYLVFDEKRRRHVALKTLLPIYIRHEYAVGRFVREIVALKRLKHPGIIEMYDARRYGSLLYYTMEYVQGATLRRYLQKYKRMSLKTTVRVLAQLCDVLEHVHAVTVHRDISPENIMITEDHSVKLLDFGLAKTEKKVVLLEDGTIQLTDYPEREATPDGEMFTSIGASLGKAGYTAPEQLADARYADRRADLYSLGVVFFEMLSGRLPESYEPVTKYMPELPLECDAFLQKAMAFDPERRFSTAEEFRQVLGNVYQISLGQRDARVQRLRHVTWWQRFWQRALVALGGKA